MAVAADGAGAGRTGAVSVTRDADPAPEDRSPVLSPAERSALADVVQCRARPPAARRALGRLLDPLEAVLAERGTGRTQRNLVLVALLATMERTQQPYWAWTRAQWCTAIDACRSDARHYVVLVGYRLGGYTDLYREIANCRTVALARRVLGTEAVTASLARMREIVAQWGYHAGGTVREVHHVLAPLLLASRSGRLEGITAEAVAEVGRMPMRATTRRALAVVCRVLVSLGVLCEAVPLAQASSAAAVAGATEGIPAEWLDWCQRWERYAPLAPQTRRGYSYNLRVAGRWLGATCPALADPRAWRRESAAMYVAAVSEMTIGQWSHPRAHVACAARIGQPLSPRSKDRLLRVMSAFFRDCQQWEWLTPRFDPRVAFRTPRHIQAQIGPDPRVIAQDCWGKLLWAGLNLTESDLGVAGGTYRRYPLAMVQAIAVTWLFAGLRADELCRLPVGCVRWQRAARDDVGAGEEATTERLCFLDVPVNKTSPGFSKPVDRPVGDAITAWEGQRPMQPAFLDRKTRQSTAYLFAYRGQRLGSTYLNAALIPMLCRKAGIPTRDARGPITSHRARSTIASMLFNAKQPLSLLELKEWLGHRDLATTQHYVAITPTRRAQALRDADYFGRVLRTVDVLVDKAAVTNGTATAGAPWLYYDLGHGYCTHPYFSQCPHRLLCAQCAFYRPKAEMAALLAQATGNLVRLQEEIPLTDEERAVVEEDRGGYEHLLTCLADVPTLDGTTPNQLREDALPNSPP
jgi:integrase